MTCNACGRDVPLIDKSCADCYEEGPFTRASRITPWVRHFAWLPIRLSCGARAWLCHVEVKEYYCFEPVRHVRKAQQTSDGAAR